MKQILTFRNKEHLEILKEPIGFKVTVFDNLLKKWAKELTATTKAHICYGLAAPQIGIRIRMICLYCVKEKEPIIMINPELVSGTGRMKFEERCLSFPGLAVKTKRKAFIYIKYQDVDGKSQEYFANGVTAVCIQHEIDHLNGVLLSDHGPLYKVK